MLLVLHKRWFADCREKKRMNMVRNTRRKVGRVRSRLLVIFRHEQNG